MSRIDKLSILGVRSFDNKRAETIEFFAPLTLIVGSNGCGKTTIIECLKYATTGDLPQYGKSGNFVHDPQLAGESEVLAKVMLAFRTNGGSTRYVAARSQQVTVKKGAKTFKNLDSSLKIIRGGENNTHSSRVSELNALVPHYLGVSKAVLENVIFCHQEDSLWPLEESSKLKQRFDAIFEAVKYTKAIDSIRVLRKTKMGDLAGFQKEEEHSKVIKGKAEQNQKRTQELHNRIEEGIAERDSLLAREREAAKTSQEFQEQADKIGEIVGLLTGKRIEERTMDQNVRRAREFMNEISDSDEALQHMLDQYEERVGKLQADIDKQKELYATLGENVKDTRKQISVKYQECGNYEAQKQHYDQQVEARERMVKETARNHNIRGFDMEVDDAQVRAFMDRVAKLARDQNAAFERARRETQDETQRAQQVLNQLNEKKSALNQRKENARQIMSTNERKIANLQTELQKIRADEGGKTSVESNLRANEEKLEKAKLEKDGSDWDTSIASTETDLRQLEDRKDKLNEELMEGTRQAGDSARLDYLRKELRDSQNSLETMDGAHGQTLSSILGHDWSPAKVEEDYKKALGRADSQVAEAERQREGTMREKDHVEFQLTSAKSDIKSRQDAMTAAAKAIWTVMEVKPQEYPDTVKDLEHSREVVKSDASAYAKVLEYFDSCLKTAAEHKSCRTCFRRFNNDKELENMRKTVEKERKKYEGSDDLKKDLEETEKDLKEARSVSSDYDTWNKAKEELPALEENEKKLSQKRQQLLRVLEDQDAVVRDKQTARRDVQAVERTVQNIFKYVTDIGNFTRQIEDLAAKQKTAGMSRGLENIQEDIKKVDTEIKEVRARLNKSKSDRDRSSALLNTLELERRDIQSKLTSIEHELKEKRSLNAQIEEYRGLNNTQREAMRSVDQELQELDPQMLQAQAKFDDVARRGEDKDRELQGEKDKINKSLADLSKADEDVKAYIERGGPQQLARGQRELQSLHDEIANLEKEQNAVVKEVKTLEDQHRNHEETKRNLQYNQSYRSDLRQLEAVRAEIEELESHNAEEDREHYESEARKWQLERNKLASKGNQLSGSLGALDGQLKQLIDDYDTQYKDAAKKHKQAHINVETTKACVEDLGRYGGALDKAVMKYHALKMEEINSYITELWQKTYQGTDVDTIMIRSESEGAKNSRSHNYRLVMVKQDAEMDMRGRCSAGQKVLASIIVRLALAEAFGKNCGVIALDEPTTNLDEANIGALAASLHRIINDRKSEPNFQLIVITHDETFLRQMNCGDFADSYWRVSRNQYQKSQIEKQDISEVI